MELAEIADLALAELRRFGPQFADVRVEDDETESLDVRDEQINGVERAFRRGVGIRALVGGRWGFAAASTVDQAAVRRTCRLAVDIARSGALVPGPSVKLDDSEPVTGAYTTPHAIDPFDVPVSTKADHLMTATAEARRVTGVAYATATTDARRRRTVYRSTDGAAIEQEILHVGGGLTVYAIEGGEMQRRSYPAAFRGRFATGGWERVLELDLPGHAAAAGREAVALLRAPDLPYVEDATVVLESSQLAMQVHESVGHPLEMDRILGAEQAYAGGSFVRPEDRGRLRYGSPLVSVTADATVPGGPGTFGFDDEGVPASRTELVVEGLLVGALTDRQAAARFGERSNGAARADSWASIPLVRMTNVYLEPGADAVALDDLVADTRHGFLLATNRSWSIDDRRTNFQFGCEIAYEIRHGRLGRLYRNPSYGGRTLDFWRSCDGLGGRSDWRLWSVPICGKGQPGQTVTVGNGAPTGRFRAHVGVRR